MDQSDAADDQVLRPFAGLNVEQLYRKGPVVRAQYESSIAKFDIGDDEIRAAAHGIGRRPGWAVLDSRVVMPVDDDQSLREDDGLHRKSIGSRDADGNEALPGDAVAGCVRPDELKRGRRQRHHFQDRGRIDDRLEESGSMRNDRNESALHFGELDAVPRAGQEIFGLDFLRSEDAIDGLGRQAPLSVEEVGEVGLSEAGLPGEERHAKGTAPDSAQQFVAKVIVHLDEFHLRIVFYELWIKKVLFFI